MVPRTVQYGSYSTDGSLKLAMLVKVMEFIVLSVVLKSPMRDATKRIMAYSDQSHLRCSGLVPVSEDWHT